MSPAAINPTPHKMGTSPGPRTCASPAAWRVRGGGGSERRPLGLFGSPVSERADICERLIRDGKLRPHADGLFADDSQTWGLA